MEASVQCEGYASRATGSDAPFNYATMRESGGELLFESSVNVRLETSECAFHGAIGAGQLRPLRTWP